jgi:serine/threonine-protein kinase HipA
MQGSWHRPDGDFTMRLDVWLDGVRNPVGTLESFDSGAVDFTYSEAYLASPVMSLSQSLPLQYGGLGDVLSRAFFDNLLPENDQTRHLIEREGISRDDIVGILHHLGADCSGAISCLPEGAPPVKVPGDLSADYRPLGEASLVEIMKSLTDFQRLPYDTRDPSPLAGVQGKMALTLLPDGQIALPATEKKVPSTHILKVPARAHQSDVDYEWAACVFMAKLGLSTSMPRRLNIEGVKGLLITRFDRWESEGHIRRLHQEDFAQAMGLPRALKYERRGREGRAFTAEGVYSLLDCVRNPAIDRRLFIMATLINLALGNNDNHAKNHALLYVNSNIPVLAPFYDILPARLNDDYSDQLAFDIGTAKRLEEITADDIAAFFATFDIEGSRYRRFLETEVKPALNQLDQLAKGLSALGMKAFDDLIGNNLMHFAEITSLNLNIRERDLFVARGGGWMAGS